MTIKDLEALLAEVEETAHAEAAIAAPESWPDELRLIADIVQDAVPLLEGGKKANVWQLLATFGKLQAAYAAFKALRSPLNAAGSDAKPAI